MHKPPPIRNSQIADFSFLEIRKAAMRKLSKKQLKHFADCVYEWQGLLSLNDWRITIEACELENHIGALVAYVADQHLATIRCQLVWDELPSDDDLNRNALHECLHIRMASLCDLVPKQCAEQLDSIEHAIIRNLENILVGR